MSTIALYSIQPLSVWRELCAGETVTACPKFEDDEEQWRASYQWLRSQMVQRGVVGLTAAAPEYPMWAWSGQKPDLRSSMMRTWALKERMVLLTLNVDKERVLESDYDGWHSCLNYWYLGPELESDAFLLEVKAALNTSYYRTKPLPEPYNGRIRKSWERIFDVQAGDTVQATLWQFRIKDVVAAKEFGMRGKSLALALPA